MGSLLIFGCHGVVLLVCVCAVACFRSLRFFMPLNLCVPFELPTIVTRFNALLRRDFTELQISV